MNKLIIAFNLFLISSSQLYAQKNETIIVDVPQMMEVIEAENEGVRVVNFWATWCKPCVAELPYFIQAAKENPQVEFVFISIDFADQVKKVDKFSQKKGMDSYRLYLIDDLDYNAWIDKVSPQWTGAIPATLIMKNGQKHFYEKQFHEGELQEVLNKHLTN